MVVRRLDFLRAGRRADGRLESEEVLGDVDRLRVRDFECFGEHRCRTFFEGAETLLERLRVYQPGLEVLREREDPSFDVLGLSADLGALAAAVDELLVVAKKVRPVQLSEANGPLAIDTPPLGGEDPLRTPWTRARKPSRPRDAWIAKKETRVAAATPSHAVARGPSTRSRRDSLRPPGGRHPRPLRPRPRGRRSLPVPC